MSSLGIAAQLALTKQTVGKWRQRYLDLGLDVHLILDNYRTHKTQQIRDWLMKRPRFHLHFTPTSSSWLNLVERWYAMLTE